MSEPKRIMTREELAKVEVGVTEVSRPVKAALIAFFLAVIACVPLVQVVGTLLEYAEGERASPIPQPLSIFRAPGEAAAAWQRTEGGFFDKLFEANAALIAARKEYETQLETASYVGSAIRPPAQLAMAAWLGAGNEKAYPGRGRWLFFRPGFDYVTGPPFLDPNVLAMRAASGDETVEPPQPDPRAAIIEFRDQLAERGIELVLVPAPVKFTVHPERFTARYAGRHEPVQNPDFEPLLEDLRAAGVHVFDPAPALAAAAADEPQYLATDTHWRPDAMEATAAALADFIRDRVDLPEAATGLTVETRTVTNTGDVAALLDLPESQTVWPPETARIHQVRGPGGDVWRTDTGADVLVLGDSFVNVYSLAAMEWGESAGFVEHLSVALDLPLDRIVQNDNGAFATRLALSRELARGRDRLDGKRVVVWEFAARELSVGDWKRLPMDLGEPVPAKGAGAELIADDEEPPVTVTGTVAAGSGVPPKGAYKNHVRAVHLVDIARPEKGPIEHGQVVVYLQSIRDDERTPAAGLRIGDRVTVRVWPWESRREQYGGIQRSELEDWRLQLLPTYWAEIAEEAGVGPAPEAPERWWPVLLVAGVLGLVLALRVWSVISPKE